MIARAASLAAVCIATLSVQPASAIVWSFSLPQPERGHQSFWPEGLKDAVRHPGYVGGEHFVAPGWGGGHESTTLHYRGDAESFNRFLAAYAKLDAPRLTVTIHPGVPDPYDTANTRISPGSNSPEFKPYDWRLSVNGSQDPNVLRAGRGLGPDDWRVHVRIDFWAGGNIAIDDVRVPPGMTVEAGGEIGAFIARYAAEESRRADAETAP